MDLLLVWRGLSVIRIGAGPGHYGQGAGRVESPAPALTAQHDAGHEQLMQG